MKKDLLFILGIVIILTGVLAIFVTTPLRSLGRNYTDPDDIINRVQMMDGQGMHQGKMHGNSGIIPAGTTPEGLPDPDNPGAKLLSQYCSQCHNLPSPAMHTAVEWQSVLTRMVNRMEKMAGSRGMMRGMMKPQIPSSDEQNSLLIYLRKYALRPAKLETIESAETPGRSLFRKICSQCHASPDPELHHAPEWPSVVDRMRQNMKSMGKHEISDEERNQILEFLIQHAEPSP